MAKSIESVFEVTLPMRIFCKAFGFQLFTVFKSEKESQKIKASSIDIICGIFSFTCYAVVLGVNIKWDIYDGYTSSLSMNLISRCIAIYGSLVQAVGVLINIYFRKCNLRLLQNLHKCDSIMRIHNIDQNFARQYRVILRGVIGFVGLMMLLAITTLLLHGDVAGMSAMRHLCHTNAFVITISYVAFMLQFIFTLMVIRWRFSTLNNAFRKRFSLGRVQEFSVRKVDALKLFWKENAVFITDLSIMHDLLTDSVSLLNSCFSVQAMCWICASFGLNVLGFYTFYRCIVQNRWDELLITAIYAIWQSYDYMFVLLAIKEGSNITRQSRKMAILIHKAINKHMDSPPLTEKLKLLSQQLLHRRPEVSCGFFTFDWPFVAATVGAMSMYLTIMIQFDATASATASSA
ncbi:uncharacterized protein LOC132265270 [Phlebotomus argentipes]|uniref:uncharacterized protein LOC132265270 n=1 Tax=Phlebotomus argentipes TaxID=94469 RepID=UPI00289302A2|nr:uncharacterized protein LOC132265270 [Phlebotomus argentipes]